MTVRELREKYLAFFESKGHKRFPSGSLVPYDVTGKLDESLLFNGAGMIQFKPYFRGIAQPEHPRLTTVQKCVRTNDIDEVGDATHLSFFEMLGNFSFGDYFKNQAIDFSWEFLTSKEWLGLDPTRLAFTIFENDDDAYDSWAIHLRGAGIDPDTRIFRLGEETNYWPAGAFSKGPPGPCGPNSEMFYWTSDAPPPVFMTPKGSSEDSQGSKTPGTSELPHSTLEGSQTYTREDFLLDDEKGNWVEIWNDVFIQYEWQGHPDASGKGYVKDAMPELPFRSIDTGMGLDRTAFVLSGKKSVYENGAFDGIFRILNELTGDNLDYATDPSPKGQAARIVADHVRNAAFCIADGIIPGNTGRGYVVKRLLRRAVLKGQRTLGLGEAFLYKAFEGVVETMGDFYPELEERRDTIVTTLRNEEDAFRRTLERGVNELTAQAFRWQNELEELFFKVLEENAELRGQIDDPVLRGLYNDPHRDYKRIEPDGGYGEWRKAFDLVKPGHGLQPLRERLSSFLNRADYASASVTQDLRKALDAQKISGERAFQLYSTYGFPLEVTQELAAEAGVEVDVEGYEAALKADQALARGAQGEKSAYGDVQKADELAIENAPGTTVFTGYRTTEGTGRIVRIRQASPSPEGEGRVGVSNADASPANAPTTLLLALDETPFYATSGGQTADTGTLTLGDGTVFHVEDVTKEAGTFWHRVTVPALTPDLLEDEDTDVDVLDVSPEALLGQTVNLEVDADRRRSIMRNHTATHLLQAALRETIGGHVAQAGSYVGPERLRFDFAHGKALTPDEIETVERRVNERILHNEDVTTYEDLPIAEAKARGAMALFGEKYGATVRMVEVGDFSRELCGGIHVRTAGEIGLFRIVSESSAAGGVRRIEAVTGEGAYELARAETQRIREAAALLKASPGELVQAVERAMAQVREERQRREKAEKAALSGASIPGGTTPVKEVNGVNLWVRDFGDVDPKTAAAAVDDAAAQAPNQVTLAAVVTGGKVQFIAKAGAEAVTKGAHAGNLLKEVSRIAGGGGGGRAEFATAGGKDPSKIADALTTAEAILKGQLGG